MGDALRDGSEGAEGARLEKMPRGLDSAELKRFGAVTHGSLLAYARWGMPFSDQNARSIAISRWDLSTWADLRVD